MAAPVTCKFDEDLIKIEGTIEIVRDFMDVLVTCRFDEALIKNEVVIDRTNFPHYKSMGAFGCHGNQSFHPICPQTLRSLSSTPMML